MVSPWRIGPPPLVLGSVQWGMPYGIANRSGQPARDEVASLLQLAGEAGIATIDTARAYGEAEAVIGELAGQDWRVVSKLALSLGEPQARDEALVAAARDSLETSLRTLRRERLDVLMLHRAEHRDIAGGAVWQVLREAREAGRIGRLGYSAARPEQAMAALDDPEVEIVQVATNLLDQRLLRAGFFERAAARGLEVHVRSVFLQGVAFLDPRWLPADLDGLRAPMRRIRRWARERGLEPAAVFLHFARTLPVDALVVGCERHWQLESNLGFLESEIDERELAQLAREVGVEHEALVDPSRWAA